MPKHLVVLNIGPVQGFIATARRTRDLWFGSWVLSEISKTAALSLKKAGAILIFPAQQTNLQDPKISIANRVLAEINTDNPKSVLEKAQVAATECWKNLAEQSLTSTGLPASKIIREDLWNSQRDDVLECTWAWTQFLDNEPFSATHDRLKKLEAARKATRDFNPAARCATEKPGYGLPKSSLDGARETVLREDLKLNIRLRLGLSAGEHLDCPGLVKRLCGGNIEQFTPTSRIALDPWLRRIPEAKLATVCEAYEPLVGYNLATRVKGNGDIYKALPYDGQLLLPARSEALLAGLEKYIDAEQHQHFEEIKAALSRLQQVARPLWKEYGEPNPYVALLLADGDRMGELLDHAQQKDPAVKYLRKISDQLAEFAGNVPELIRQYRSHCIYAGGDDVLALLPLDKVLCCTRKLHDEFGKALTEQATHLGVEKQPTLSIGIAIQHCLSPLGELRELAKRAEKLAKGDKEKKDKQRDGLGIIIQTRSGAPLEFRDCWSTKPDEPDERLRDWGQLITADALSDKAPYDLREAALAIGEKKDQLNEELAIAEAHRVLKRKRGAGGTQEFAETHKEILKKMVKHAGTVGLTALANELLVARWLQRISQGDKS